MAERRQSARQALTEVLLQGAATLRDLSVAASLSEKEVADHLPHIAQSAKRAKLRFVVEPASCRRCDFVFESRSRVTTPSRCAKCRSERIHPARFSLEHR